LVSATTSIERGDIWWADLADPQGRGPEFTRPVLVVQGDAFNRSAIGTVIAVSLTSNTRLADAPGNVWLDATESGLERDSVVNVSQLSTLDRDALRDRVGRVNDVTLELVDHGLKLLLGLE
jgi:mRNA interferase MazF